MSREFEAVPSDSTVCAEPMYASSPPKWLREPALMRAFHIPAAEVSDAARESRNPATPPPTSAVIPMPVRISRRGRIIRRHHRIHVGVRDIVGRRRRRGDRLLRDRRAAHQRCSDGSDQCK